jgi:hypothetical protein
MATPHSTENYTVGKGVVSIAAWTGSVVGAYQDMGNCPRFEVTPNIERLEHFSSRSGYRTKDKTAITQLGYTLDFDLDELAAENIAKFLTGTLSGGNVISAMQDVDRNYSIRLVEDNPAGPNKTWNFWKVTLSPSGALSLIGDGSAWAMMSYTAEGLSDTAGHPTSPYITVTYATTTTTTTTTTS